MQIRVGNAGLEIFHINALERAGRPTRASKSKLRRHDKVCLGHNVLDNFSFYKFCLFICVGYKMETCTHISDFVGK